MSIHLGGNSRDPLPSPAKPRLAPGQTRHQAEPKRPKATALGPISFNSCVHSCSSRVSGFLPPYP